MRLDDFLQDHPGCVVGRPDLLVPLATSALAACGLIGMTLLALRAAQSPAATDLVVLCSALALGAAAGLVHQGRHLRTVLTLRYRGTCCYAIGDEQVALINAAGGAVVVELGQVVRLELDGDEVRLSTDSDQQGVIYAALFDLFDSPGPRPSSERFFEQLAPRVQAQAPEAFVHRRAARYRAFVTSRPSA